MLILLSSLLLAGEPKVVYKKETEIDFESVEIEGQIKKPQQALIVEKTRAIFNPLIQIRESWANEMTTSLNQIQ